MFGLFHKKDSSSRVGFQDEFENTISKLKKADELNQVAVGHSLNMANSIFIQRFKSIESFRQLTKDEKFNI